MIPQRHIRILALLLGLSACAAAGATEIYTWVDEEGITHFSQTPPVDATTDTQTLQLQTGGAVERSGHVDAMIELANQLEASRLAREQASLERRVALEHLALEQKRLEQSYEQSTAPAYHYPVTVYSKARHRRHGPKHRPRKAHECSPHCAEPASLTNPPFHRSGRHGTSHLRPYKSLPSDP